MPPRHDARQHLWDMMHQATRIIRTTHGVTFEQFLVDEDLQLLIQNRLLTIGEAASRVSQDFRAAHPEIPWRDMIAQRNVLVHQYDEVDPVLVWESANHSVPELIRLLEPLLGMGSEGQSPERRPE